MEHFKQHYRWYISIHSLHTEGDIPRWELDTISRNFNPLPPHGGRQKFNEKFPADKIFQSTPSTRRETEKPCFYYRLTCISIHSLHTEGDRNFFYLIHNIVISIHSLHTEGDSFCAAERAERTVISIHSLHTEGDMAAHIASWNVSAFQSTPSTRRETLVVFINPYTGEISIHSLHTEGDSES